jgi:hypothetical protein
MSNISLVPPGPDAPGSDGNPTPNRYPGRRPAAAQKPDAAQFYDPEQRLVIQEDGDTGALVYTVIDRASGQVVAKTSREEVARMSERADYSAGSLIKAKA